MAVSPLLPHPLVLFHSLIRCLVLPALRVQPYLLFLAPLSSLLSFSCYPPLSLPRFSPSFLDMLTPLPVVSPFFTSLYSCLLSLPVLPSLSRKLACYSQSLLIPSPGITLERLPVRHPRSTLPLRSTRALPSRLRGWVIGVSADTNISGLVAEPRPHTGG